MWKVLFAAYVRGVPVRKVCFFVVQKVTGRGFVADKKVSVECARIVFSGPRLSVRPNSAILQGGIDKLQNGSSRLHVTFRVKSGLRLKEMKIILFYLNYNASKGYR